MANVIAQNIFEQVGADGYSTTKFDAIIDFKKNEDAICFENSMFKTKSGKTRTIKSTQGWIMLVRFTDGTNQWVPLRILKEVNPVETADYAIANNIANQPVFSYWVPYVIRKRDVIISSISQRLRKTNTKYGIKIPKSMNEVNTFDIENGNNLWHDATAKETANIMVAFEILEDNKVPPPGWTKSSGHMIWDVKLDFTHKDRWVKDGHCTPDPEWSIYSGVVSCETVGISLTYAALNNLKVCAADIQNTYLQAPASEKHYVICGPEFGLENIGKNWIN